MALLLHLVVTSSSLGKPWSGPRVEVTHTSAGLPALLVDDVPSTSRLVDSQADQPAWPLHGSRARKPCCAPAQLCRWL
jgi:hypothetical protein